VRQLLARLRPPELWGVRLSVTVSEGTTFSVRRVPLRNQWVSAKGPMGSDPAKHERDGDLPAFMQQVTNTHVKRWKEHRHEIGYGHLYQGRSKCFPVETEDYFYQVVRYVERNALRANLVERAESWRWSSLRRVEREDPAFPIVSTWPLPRPTDWLQLVNQSQTEAEVAALRCCVNRGRPFGDPNWVTDTAKRLGLEWTIGPRGRPKKQSRL